MAVEHGLAALARTMAATPSGPIPTFEWATVVAGTGEVHVVLDSDPTGTPRPVSDNAAGPVAVGQRVYVAHHGLTLTILASPSTGEASGAIIPIHAVGDGITDDTWALQTWLDELSARGGRGYLPPGRYRTTDTLTVIAPTHGWVIEGAGVNDALIEPDLLAAGNALSIRGADGLTIANLGVRGVANVTHGISASNSRDCVIRDVEIRGWGSTAVMFFTHAGLSGGASARNHMTRVWATGDGTQLNGLMHESSPASTMSDCRVTNLDRRAAASPSYALQFKNPCPGSTITGGMVDGAKAGVAFGQDSALVQTGVTVTGVVVRNCDHGLLASFIDGCDIDLSVDMASDPACQTAVNLAGTTTNNRVRVTISGLPESPTVTAIRAGSSGNIITLERTTRVAGGTTLTEFVVGSSRNLVLVGTVAGSSGLTLLGLPVTDAGSNNSVGFLTLMSEATTHLAGGTSMQRFTAPGSTGNWILYNHAASRFQIRAAGNDALYVDAGGPLLRAPDNTLWRLVVSNSGALTTVQA